MLWHICCNYQPHPPPQPPMLYWNVSLFKYYHNARDSKLLIRKGLYFLHPVSPSPSCLCLFALHLFEVFLCLHNSGLHWWRKCLYMLHLCSNNTIGFPELLEVAVALVLMNRICTSFFVKLHTSFVHIDVRWYIYYWMNSSVCRVSACAHENNMAQFPFLWTIQLPLSGRLMERGLLDQCHRASGMPRRACPPCYRFLCFHSPPPQHTRTHTRSNSCIHVDVVIHALFLTNSHSSLTISHPSVDRIHSDIWQAHQHFSSSHSTDSQPVETQT